MRTILTALVTVIAAIGSNSATAGVYSYMNDLVDNPAAQKVADGYVIRAAGPNKEGRIQTKTEINSGFVATFVAKTSSTNLRLYYGDHGVVIFNWEKNPNELRYCDLKTGQVFAVPDKGAIPRNTYVTVTWTIHNTYTAIAVDGVERARFDGDYGPLKGSVGVGTYAGGVVTLKSLTCGVPTGTVPTKTTPVKPAPAQAPAKPSATAEAGDRVFVAVPAQRPASGAARPVPLAPTTAIERPEYRDLPRRLDKSITSITAMMVRIAADGQANGLTSDIIATVPPNSRTGDKAGAGFSRPDGDATMRTAFEEAVRAVNLRYPLWEPGLVDVSFGEKFVAHGGPSAGTAFALLLLSTLEGFDIDPKCAITGDITVDWKVRKVGGVTAKVRGAALDKCLYAAIPDSNETAIADMAVHYGDSALWEIQVFSIGTLHQAASLVRADRPRELAEAIDTFAKLQPTLAKGGRGALFKPDTKQTLKRVLELAPNHLSARQLLAIAENKASRTLSANATLYQLSVLFYPFREVLAQKAPPDRTTLPAHVTVLARKRMNALRPIAHKDIAPLVASFATFIEALDNFAATGKGVERLLAQGQLIDQRLSEMGSDSKLIETLVREGY